MRKTSFAATEGKPQGGLKPWREVVTPHSDVVKGTYQQAEFAADLWQVYQNEGSDEYQNPTEFFRRTFITEGLKGLLTGALVRLAGKGGNPVVELQTNFGGGKTHSMMSLWHLFSGISPSELLGVEELVKEAGVPVATGVHRAVLVGTKISPGQTHKKPDGTVVRTLWGELAWQLGGKPGYEMVKDDDQKGTNPGDTLKKLFNRFAPCLILIDEWIAYARQLRDEVSLPAGTFDTQFTFAQALSEAAKAAKQTVLVVSIPESKNEIGGSFGQAALEQLKNAIGRVESPWHPARPDESFEIVRRRLFEPMTGDQFIARDAVAKAFSEMYGSQHQEFPPDCREADLRAPDQDGLSHPPRAFRPPAQRLVGLGQVPADPRCLAADGGRDPLALGPQDSNLLIMPATIPIDDPKVQDELTRYLEDQWMPIIEKDVDGPNSLAACGRPGNADLGTLFGLPPGSADDLHGLCADPEGGQSRHRRPPGQARLRSARRGRGHVWRRLAAIDRPGDVSLCRWQTVLVFDPAHRHPAGRRPGQPEERMTISTKKSPGGCAGRPVNVTPSARSMPVVRAPTFRTSERPGW